MKTKEYIEHQNRLTWRLAKEELTDEEYLQYTLGQLEVCLGQVVRLARGKFPAGSVRALSKLVDHFWESATEAFEKWGV